MEIKKFTITRIDLAKEGWNMKQTADFFGVTLGEFWLGMEQGKYPNGEMVEGGMRWHPVEMELIKAILEGEFVPFMAIGSN